MKKYKNRKDFAKEYDGLTVDKKHLILREAYRNYLSFQQYVADTGKDVIEYAIPLEEGSEEWTSIVISFTDLERALRKYTDGLRQDGTILSKRKEEAFYLHIIRDMRQRDVADIMGINCVTIGQYVNASCKQLSKYYFSELEDEDTLNGHLSKNESVEN